MDLPIKYRVATISVDSNGSWTIQYAGDAYEQGGVHFGTVQMTFSDRRGCVNHAKRVLKEHADYYLQRIKEIEAYK